MVEWSKEAISAAGRIINAEDDYWIKDEKITAALDAAIKAQTGEEFDGFGHLVTLAASNAGYDKGRKDGRAEALEEVAPELYAALERGAKWKGAWREAIAELEDFCSEPVRLKNMVAALDALDEWHSEAIAALAKAKGE